MNKIKNSSMFLLWVGAAISISEIYTGGIIAPLGLKKGLAAIIIGHIIGTLFLAFGGYICFLNKQNAMDNVKSAMGSFGAKIIALLNILQLMGWSAVMIIQGGRALNAIFTSISFNICILIMAIAVFIWAYSFNNYSKLVNDISVIVLVIVCLIMFFKIAPSSSINIKEHITFATAIELAIAMPVSWLPLIGDYSKNGETSKGVFLTSFLGYFIGSVFMYIMGLLITLNTGKDIIEFISGTGFGFVACAIIVLSTVTTTFLDIYSAVVSSKQIININKENTYIISYSIIAMIIAYVFPIEQYENFLLVIGSVFIPVYTVVFCKHLFQRERVFHELNIIGIIMAVLGTLLYNYFNNIQFGCPTVLVFIIVSLFYIGLQKGLLQFVKNK